MLNRTAIAALVPQQGAMCLLDAVEIWSAESIICRTETHLSPANPMRHAGRLSTLCGCEFGLQAAALHAALNASGVAQPAGYLAGVRVSLIARPFLDDPEIGTLRVEALLDMAGPGGVIYAFALRSAVGDLLLQGRATIRLPEPTRR